LADTPQPFADLDKWLRRRLRQVRWKEWKVPPARRRNLIALGVSPGTAHQWAGSSIGPWRMAGSPPLQRSLTNAYWTSLGLQGFTEPYRGLRGCSGVIRCPISVSMQQFLTLWGLP